MLQEVAALIRTTRHARVLQVLYVRHVGAFQDMSGRIRIALDFEHILNRWSRNLSRYLLMVVVSMPMLLLFLGIPASDRASILVSA